MFRKRGDYDFLITEAPALQKRRTSGLLPRKMRERFVGLGHLVDVLAFFHGFTFIFGGSNNFFGEFDMHGLAFL